LFQQTALAVLASGRRWVVGSAAGRALPLYLRLGFADTGLRLRLFDQDHTIFTGDIAAAYAGKGIDPMTWNIVFGPIWRMQHGAPPEIWATGPRVRAYRCLAPLARLVARRQLRSAR
jgi:hypothetical protein